MKQKRPTKQSYLKRRYIDRYDKTASIYNLRYYQEQQRKYETILNFIDKVNTNSALDLGCGTGLFIRQIINHSNTIIGVDVSKKMLDEAKKIPDSLTNVYLIRSDADFLPLKDNLFDIVFAFTILQNMPAPEQTIREIIRVAKTCSTIVLTAQKRVFEKERFKNMLENEDLHVSKIFDDNEVKDYVAVCEKQRN